jgi:hypothetical protein
MTEAYKNKGIIGELWDFLKIRKKWWLTPIILLLIFGILLILFGGGNVNPFAYTLR